MLKYIQHKNGIFIRHIHDVEPTQWDENNFCFARKLSQEQREYFGVSKLKIVTPPYFDKSTQKRIEGPALFQDGVWVQQYIVTPLDEDERQIEANSKSLQVREDRNFLLASSDWTQVIDAPVNQNEWAVYRQALRDLTNQTGFPWTVNWPTKP
jgi:hypothetical protein